MISLSFDYILKIQCALIEWICERIPILPFVASMMLYTTTFTFFYAFHAVFHCFCVEFRKEKGGGTPIWATCVFVCPQSCVFIGWGLSHNSNSETPGLCTAQGVRKASSRVAISALDVY